MSMPTYIELLEAAVAQPEPQEEETKKNVELKPEFKRKLDAATDGPASDIGSDEDFLSFLKGRNAKATK